MKRKRQRIRSKRNAPVVLHIATPPEENTKWLNNTLALLAMWL